MGKYKKLALSLVLDFIGVITIFDVIWAPFSAYIMTRMYPGNKGKVAGVVSFIEEILPGLDIIPTFTIMWFYTYVFSRNKERVIEVKG